MKFIQIMDGNLLEEGVWFQFNDPISGDPLFRDVEKTLPCRARVRSNLSKTYRSANMREVQKNQATIQRAKKSEREALENEMLDSASAKWFAHAVVAFENCDSERAGIVTPTREELFALADATENQWMVNQVLEASADQSRYGVAPADPIKGGEEHRTRSRSKASSPS